MNKHKAWPTYMYSDLNFPQKPQYYHLCSTVKRECFFTHVYFSNEACACDFRKMEASKVNKFGRSLIALEHRRLKLTLSEELLYIFYIVNNQLVKCDKVTAVIYYYTTTKFHYAKRDSTLSEYGGVNIEVSYF